jgi:hypothetical protein
MSQTAAARTTTRRTLRPTSLTVTTANGETFTLNKRQPTHTHICTRNGVYVHVGDRVTAGQHIGDVGSDGRSTARSSAG